jgi:two-component system, NarL family, sensor histidine kinase UhpB
LGNAAISGIVLTICDVTMRRRLEREVLEIAVHERERLASDIRDGLGLELNGIKGLLARLKTPQSVSDSPARSVDGVIAQVNRTIDLARKLAVNLSPLHVARGSLELAMGRLAQETAQRFSLRVDLEQDLQQLVIPGPEADHLYRIAQEVLDHEARSGNCSRIKIDLCVAGDRLVLSIDGNGGTSSPFEGEAALGLRMAEYRARMIGGVMRRERTWEGNCVEVSVPLQSIQSTAPPDIPGRIAANSDRMRL